MCAAESLKAGRKTEARFETNSVVLAVDSKQEIREVLAGRGLKTSSVTLASGPTHWARVTPADAADFWEDWRSCLLSRPNENNNNNSNSNNNNSAVIHLRGHKVTVSPSTSDNLLCVNRLPRDLVDDEFKDLVAAYGPIRRSFLLYSDKTGIHLHSTFSPFT